jgi:predicted metal-dependent RNase
MAAQRQSPRPRLMIDISPELRRRIKIAATQKDLSIREYIESILEQVVPKEVNLPGRGHHRITQEDIEQLNRVREQIRKKHPRTVFTDSAEIVRQMREERSEYLADL